VPLVLRTSTKNACPFLISNLACVVEISLSLYKLTPFSLNNLPVDLPILNVSSSSTFANRVIYVSMR
jgi:hypothetical protein